CGQNSTTTCVQGSLLRLSLFSPIAKKGTSMNLSTLRWWRGKSVSKRLGDSRLQFRPSLEALERRDLPALTVVGAAAGGTPLITVRDETGKVVNAFNAFPASFRGGVNVAYGDITGDGLPEIVAAAGPGGGPQISIFDGKSFQLLASFFAFNPTFT